MIIFFKYITKLFIIPFLIFIFYLISIITIKEMNLSYSQKVLLFNNNLHNVECLILGTSHTLWGVDPNKLNLKTINIAEQEKPILIDIELVEKNIKSLNNLKLIILPIDYFSLYFDGKKIKSTNKYINHWGLEHYNSQNLHALNCGIGLEEIYGNFIYNSKNYNGFEPQFLNFNNYSNQKKYSTTMTSIHLMNKYQIDFGKYQQIYNKLDSFLNYMNKLNIKVLIITMPVTNFYYNSLDKKLLEINKISIKSLNDKYNNTEYINFQDLKIFKSDFYFNDPAHVNIQGALFISNFINNKLIKF